MKKRNNHNQKGAISVFVMLAMLFFIFSMIGIYSITSKRAQTQTESIGDLQKKYYSEGQESEKYKTKMAEENEVIPIYTKEQLSQAVNVFQTGASVDIEIDGKIYAFSNVASYELKNDFVINLNDFPGYNSNIIKGNYDVFCYDTVNGKYYSLITNTGESGDLEVTVNGTKYYFKELIDAKKIQANPTTYYGNIVNYEAPNSRAAKWKIFHSDGENIYLIADNYISSAYVPKGRNNSTIEVKNTDYCLSMNNVIADYTGSTDITESNPPYKWLNKYYSANYTSANNNMKAVAYMMDTAQWSVFKGNKADYAIGGPTLELFVASYNATHPDKTITTDATSEVGYRVKWTTDESMSDDMISQLSQEESLYVIKDTTNASAMWLASPSFSNADYVMYISCAGSINRNIYNYIDIGFRPVVCLSANAKLEKQADGAYNIKK